MLILSTLYFVILYHFWFGVRYDPSIVRFIHMYPCVCVIIVTGCACPYTTKMFELVPDTHMVWMCVCVCVWATIVHYVPVWWNLMAVCQCVTLKGNPGLCDVDHLLSCLSTDGNSRISSIRATANRVREDKLIQKKNNSEREAGDIYVNKTTLIPGSLEGGKQINLTEYRDCQTFKEVWVQNARKNPNITFAFSFLTQIFLWRSSE